MPSVPLPRLPIRRRPAITAAIIVALAGLLAAYTAIVTGQAHAASTLLSQGKTATASSTESATYAASAAVDGSTTTRWSSAFSDPQWLQVDLGSTDTISQVVLNWEAAYATSYQIQTSTDATTWTTIYSTTSSSGGSQTLTVTGTGRYIRLYGTARATAYGYSLWEFQVYGSTATTTCGTTNAAQGSTATASSTESAAYPASAAVDGSTTTRWSSAFSDPQWLQVDLGSSMTVCQASLNWEAAYATAYQVQISADASTWTTIYSTTTGAGGAQTLSLSGTGRYIRVYGTARATAYGYSLWEFAVYTTSTGTTSPSPSTSPTGSTGNSGNPPDSFWGDTSGIPAAANVVEVKILNRTNGQYPDSQVYWTFNGQTHSIAEQPYIDMAANSAGRMYFYLGSPTGQYWDFIEFTVGAGVFNGNTTRVDGFGLKIALRLHSHDGNDVQVGENYATFQESRSATFARFQAAMPTEFQSLATVQAPYHIPSPGGVAAFQPGGQYASYYTSYASSVGISATTQEIFGCSGPLGADAANCAALNRHVATLPQSQWSTPSLYYQASPANWYAKFWHDNAINGLAYGFPYDDYAGQSSFISHSNPQYLLVAVGW
jgi:hypothetical protein